MEPKVKTIVHFVFYMCQGFLCIWYTLRGALESEPQESPYEVKTMNRVAIRAIWELVYDVHDQRLAQKCHSPGCFNLPEV
jgi:hypothetical protein